MKKNILLLILCVLLIFGCNNIVNSNNLLNFSFDNSGNYTGFSDLPSNYTVEDAKTDGYFVTHYIVHQLFIDNRI